MAYANLDNVDALLNGDLKKRNLNKLAEVCSGKADAYIDGYLAVVYNTPFTVSVGPPAINAPALVASIAEDLVLYCLLRTGYFDGVAGNDRETMLELKRGVDKTLMDIVKGKAALPDVQDADKGSNEVLIDSTREQYHPSVDMGPEMDWGVDEDLIEELESERST
jgi:hypothetical protein